MKNLVWFALGVASGFVLAHEIAKTEKGQQVYDEINRYAEEFTAAISDGFKQKQQELRDAAADS